MLSYRQPGTILNVLTFTVPLDHAKPGGANFFFSSSRRHTSSLRDWSSDVCSSDLTGIETARLGDVRDLEQDRGGLWRRIRDRGRRHPAGDVREDDVLPVLPGLQVQRRVDGAVVAHEDQRRGVDLEVEVRRRAGRVAGVPDEAEHFAGLDMEAVLREWREGRKVRVVELVALRVAQPEAVAANVVPADREDDPVGAGEDRGSERREDVVAVVPVPGHVTPEGAESVDERDGPVNGEDVAAGGQLRMETGRNRQERRPAAVAALAVALRLRGLRGLLAAFRRGRDRLVLLRGRRLDVHLGVADLDLRPGRDAVVGRGQVDVERRDEAVEGLRAAGAGCPVETFLERRQVAPVGECDPAVRRDRGRLAEHGQPRHGRARERATRRLAAGRRYGAPFDEVRRDLASEHRDAVRLSGRARGGSRADIALRGCGQLAGRRDRAVGGVGEALAERDVVRRRRDAVRLRAGLAGDDNSDRVGMRGRARAPALLPAVRARGTGEEQEPSPEQHAEAQPLRHRPGIIDHQPYEQGDHVWKLRYGCCGARTRVTLSGTTTKRFPCLPSEPDTSSQVFGLYPRPSTGTPTEGRGYKPNTWLEVSGSLA